MTDARNRGQRVILDSDVNVYADDAHLAVVVRTGFLSAHLARAPKSERASWLNEYTQMVREADAVTVTNAELARTYRNAGAREVYVCENAVDPDDWPQPVSRQTAPFTVGFIGCPPPLKLRADSERPVRDAFAWAAAEPAVEGVFYGWRPDWEFPCRVIPFDESYATYRQRLQGLFDVVVLPVGKSQYERCRSDLKVLECAMVGALPIVQDAPNYDAWKDSPVLFARTAEEYLRQVQWAASHRDEVRERAMALREIVLRERAFPGAATAWLEAISTAAALTGSA